MASQFEIFLAEAYSSPIIAHQSLAPFVNVLMGRRDGDQGPNKGNSLHVAERKKDSPQKPATGITPANPTLGESPLPNIDNERKKIKQGSDFYSVFAGRCTGKAQIAHLSIRGFPSTIETTMGQRRNPIRPKMAATHR